MIDESSNCFSILSKEIMVGEGEVGFIIVRKEGVPSYKDFWLEKIFPIYEGTAKAFTKDLYINMDKRVRIINGYAQRINEIPA